MDLFREDETVVTFPKSSDTLPIHKNKRQIQYAVQEYPLTIVVGETGSGKSTQIPQYLLEAGWGSENRSILVVEPRRVAAISLARRVDEELSNQGINTFNLVGYTVRFEDTSVDKQYSAIHYLTDGMALRHLLWDPLLDKCSVIMLDEAHEKSVALEILSGLLKRIIIKRPDLRIIISSATINIQEWEHFFGLGSEKTAIIKVEGKLYPITIHWISQSIPLQQSIDEQASLIRHTVLLINQTMHTAGDVLVFVAGVQEIEKVLEYLGDSGLEVIPLHAGLSINAQMKAILGDYGRRSSRRRVIVSTNIAETSVTIEGIGYVIDTGKQRYRVHLSEAHIDSLVTNWCSQASAKQRAGRAGRCFSGHVYRLYTREQYVNEMPLLSVPQLYCTDIAPIVLQLKAFGVHQLGTFPFPSGWPFLLGNSIQQAVLSLYRLGAIDRKADLTLLGSHMSELPLLPTISKLLLMGERRGCLTQTLAMAACLAIQTSSLTPLEQLLISKDPSLNTSRFFAVEQGDLITMLNIYTSWVTNGRDSRWAQKHNLDSSTLLRVDACAKNLHAHLKRFGIKMSSTNQLEPILRSIVDAFFEHVALADEKTLSFTILTQPPSIPIFNAFIHPSSVLFKNRLPSCILFTDALQSATTTTTSTFQETRTFLRNITVIENPEWIVNSATDMYEMISDSEFIRRRRVYDNNPSIT